jgi:lipoic acid synthetase
MMKRLPEWLRRPVGGTAVRRMKRSLRMSGLHTVCEEARCPNIKECFGRGTATFLIMGSVCTRNCGFCDISTGDPLPLDPEEPIRIAKQAAELGLKYVLVTSVTRDDLCDGGAAHFAKTVGAIRREIPTAGIEVLTPDFKGREKSIRVVCDAMPQVFNHNVETVERLTPQVRNSASYHRSLRVLSTAAAFMKHGKIKSGLMLGLGESCSEVEKTLEDLRKAGVTTVTIGQYMRPSRNALPVVEYIPPDIFEQIEEFALKLGFERVISGPLVRSSYLADSFIA